MIVIYGYMFSNFIWTILLFLEQAPPSFKRYPLIKPPLKASILNKRQGSGWGEWGGEWWVLIRGSALFISNLKMKIIKRLVQLFDSTCMHWKRHVTITSKFITRFVYRNLISVLSPSELEHVSKLVLHSKKLDNFKLL